MAFTPILVALAALPVLQAGSAETPATEVQAAPARCDSAARGAFDFWMGQWEVHRANDDERVAASTIERLHDGCVIREHWQPLRGGGGSSLSSLDPATGRWHQAWVGAGSGRVDFEGGPAGGGMVLTGWWPGVGGPGRDGLVRMTYTPREDGSVRQHGEASFDHGLTWETSFDLIYRPRAR